jgi:D-alanyl-D-alanine carboxypeptidase/D-alanyl-D-alanine-endopeptidase (penicillin-binding protein 4)
MHRGLRLIAPLLVALMLRPAIAAVPAPVEAALRFGGIPLDAVAILVQETSSSRPALAVHAERPMTPASVMKLVTTYAALDLLGPAFTWTTEAFATGPIRDGVLEGDLVLRGRGDPKLTLEQFWLLLREVRARGVNDIRGDLVLDRSYYGFDMGDPGRFDNEPLRVYNTLPDALLVNHKAVRLTFLPDADGQRLRILAEPPLSDVRIVNQVTLDRAGCGDWRARLRTEMRTEQETASIVFSGHYSAQCGEQSRHYSILSPQAYAGAVFRQLWSELGGRLRGRVRDGLAPTDGRPLVSKESPSLAEVVRDVNKYSNNAMSRQLYLELGAATFGPPATPEKSERAIRQWLATKRLQLPDLVMENGSGLSRLERISAKGLGTLLAAAWRSPVMPEFIASMPVVGVDGTLRRRAKSAVYAGHAHIKGGTINGVRAMAGYVLDSGGRRWIVACLINHPQVHNGNAQAVFDALLLWTYNRSAPAGPPGADPLPTDAPID